MPIVRCGAVTRNRVTRGRNFAKRNDPAKLAIVRAWAKENKITSNDGKSVTDRGRIHGDILKKYNEHAKNCSKHDPI